MYNIFVSLSSVNLYLAQDYGPSWSLQVDPCEGEKTMRAKPGTVAGVLDLSGKSPKIGQPLRKISKFEINWTG